MYLLISSVQSACNGILHVIGYKPLTNGRVFSADVYFIRSRKGKLLMIVNEFSFCEESIVKNKIIWRCTSKKGKCRARIHTLGDKVISAKGLHNHPRKPLQPLKPKNPILLPPNTFPSPQKDTNYKQEALEIADCDLPLPSYNVSTAVFQNK